MGKISYLLVLPVFGMSVLIFVMMWIVPRFEMIFRDFGTELPTMTQCLIQAAYFAVNYWYVLSPLYLLFAGSRFTGCCDTSG